MKVELSEQDVRNIMAFLSRTPLEGKEAMTHVLLTQKLAAALQSVPDEPSPPVS